MAGRHTKTDRQIDPILAARHEAYGLMIAAQANAAQAGKSPFTCHQFADAPAASLAREMCAHEGFEVRPASADYPNTVAIRKRGSGRGDRGAGSEKNTGETPVPHQE